MKIRVENNRDYQTVSALVKRAFETVEISDGKEQDLVAALRNSDAFVPELSLVAEEAGKVVGHIMFTKIRINGQTALALAPLSVHPEYQRQGIGQALIKEGHKIARELGYVFSVVLGSERYYPKFGYVPAIQFGIRAPFDVPEQNYMAIQLQGEKTMLEGVVEYPKEFGIEILEQR